MAQRLDDAMAKWYLPEPNEDHILPQNDQYLRLNEIDLSKYKQESGVSTIYDDYGQEQINQSMVSKQADTVMLLCVMSDRFSEEVCRKSFDFYEDKLYLAPQLPKEWSRLAFRFVWQGCPVLLEATHENLKLCNIGAKPVELHLGNETLVVVPGEEVQHVLKEG